jgi:hypothetical protein
MFKMCRSPLELCLNKTALPVQLPASTVALLLP